MHRILLMMYCDDYIVQYICCVLQGLDTIYEILYVMSIAMYIAICVRVMHYMYHIAQYIPWIESTPLQIIIV